MLRRAVQRRIYDWEPPLPAVLQAYRSTPSESTGFTPHQLVFGREMRLPIDIGTPLPEPPRDIRTFANSLVEDLEWSYRAARETTGLQQCRSEARYKERLVKHLYTPGALVRVLHHGRHFGAPSKLDAPYSGLCEVLEVKGPVLTLRKLDSQRVFTASHDAVRLSTLRAPQQPLQNGAPPPVLVAPPAAQRPRAASPPALIAAPPPASPPAADQRSRDATTPPPPASQPFAFNSPSPHRKKPPNLMDIQLPDLSEAIQSRVANDSDDNATAPNLRRCPKRKRKSPSNLKDYFLGSTTSTFGAAQINSEYN